jgi:hypothetical protein
VSRTPYAPKAQTLTGLSLWFSLSTLQPLPGKGMAAALSAGTDRGAPDGRRGVYLTPHIRQRIPLSRVSSRRSKNGATPRTTPGKADAGTDGTGIKPGIRLHQRTEPKARTCARTTAQGCHRENLPPSTPPESSTQPRAYPHPKMPDASTLARQCTGSTEGLSGRSEVHFRLNHKRRETPDCGQDRLAHDTSGPGKRWLDTVWSAGDRSIRRVASSLSPSGSRQDMRKGDLYE